MVSKREQRSIRRHLDRRFLLQSMTLILVVVVAGIFWHQYQLVRLSTFLLQEAELLQTAGEHHREKEYLNSYLKLHPNDPQVLARLATAVDRSGRSLGVRSSAIQWHYRALSYLPERADLRARLAELLVESGRTREAEEQADLLLQQDVENQVGNRVKGQALQHRARTLSNPRSWREARTYLETAHDENPADLETARSLLEVYEHQAWTVEREREACTTMLRALLEHNPTTYGYLLRAGYRRRAGIDGVRDDLEAAVKIDPNQSDAWLALGLYTQETHDLPAAFHAFQRSMALAPTKARGYLGAGDCARLQGDPSKALEIWQQGSENATDHVLALEFRQIEVLLDLRDMEQASMLLDTARGRLDQMGMDPRNRTQRAEQHTTLKHLRGRWHATRGEWRQAIDLLTSVAIAGRVDPTNDRSVLRHRQAWMALAETYQRLGLWPEAAAAFEQVASQEVEDQGRALLSAALAYGQNKSYTRAIERCQRAVQDQQVPVDGWLLLAAILAEQQSDELPHQQDWQAVDTALERYREVAGEDWKWAFLRAQSQVARSRDGDGRALAILAAHAPRWEQIPEVWPRLAMFYERLGDSRRADLAVQHAAQFSPDANDRLLLQAGLFIERSDEVQASTSLKKIDPKQLTLSQQRQYWHLLHDCQLSEDDVRGARESLVQRVHVSPTDPTALRDLVAFDYEHFSSEYPRSLEQLASREGPQSPYVRYYHSRQLVQDHTWDRSGQQPNALTKSLAEFQRNRSNWPQRFVLQAEVALASGDRAGAAEAYLQAGNFDRYKRFSFQLMALQCLWEEADWPSVLTIAEAYQMGFSRLPVSTDAKPHASAEALLRSRIRTAPDDTDSWTALLSTLLADDSATRRWDAVVGSQPDNATATLGRLWHAHSPKRDLADVESTWQVLQNVCDPADRDLLQAELLALSGDLKGAVTGYENIPDSHPRRAAAQRRAAWLKALDGQFDDTPLRNPDAIVLDQLVLHAAAAVEQNRIAMQGPRLSDTDVMLREWRSNLLGVKTSATGVAELTTLLTDTTHHQLPEDWLLLAETLEKQGDIDGAEEQFEQLIQRFPSHYNLQRFAQFLVRHEKWEAVKPVLDTMRQEHPELWATEWVYVNWLQHQGETEKALEVLDASLQRAPQRHYVQLDEVMRWAEIAQLYDAIGQPARADGVYRKVVKLAPHRLRLVATNLADAGDLWAAIRLCSFGLNTKHEYAAVSALAMLAEQRIDQPEIRADVLPILDAKVATYPDRPDLLFRMSNIRLQQYDYERAVALLERVIQLDPEHVIAWNNLAAILAEQPDRREEAEQFIRRALTLVRKPLPTLVDTQAVVLLHQGKADEAIELLNGVTQSADGNDPRYFFHLGWAQQQNGRLDAARKSLDMAERLGLSSRYMTPTESQAYESLKHSLEL